MCCRALALAVVLALAAAMPAGAGNGNDGQAPARVAQNTQNTEGGASAPEAPPRIELTPDQRHVLFTSITSKTHVSTAAPPDFLPKPGDVVPAGVELLPLPDAVLKLMPKLQGYVCALVANQALLVDPKSRRVIEVISEGTAPPAPARS
jgi:hypothetical protein